MAVASRLEAQNIFVKELDFPVLNDFGGEGMVTKGGNFIFKQQIRYSDSSIIRLIKVDKEGNPLKEKSISNVSAKYIIQYDGTFFSVNDTSFVVSHTYEYDSSSYLTTVDTNLNILEQDTLLLGNRDCIPYRIIALSSNSIKLIASCYVNSTFHFEAIEYDLVTDQMTILDTAGYYNNRNELLNTTVLGDFVFGAFTVGDPLIRTGYFKYAVEGKTFEEFVEPNNEKSAPISGSDNKSLFTAAESDRTLFINEIDTMNFLVKQASEYSFKNYALPADIEIIDDRISILVNVLDSFLRPRPYLFTCNKSNFDSLALVPLFPSDSIIGELWTMLYDENSEAFYFTGSINDPLKRTVVVRTDKFGCVQEMCLSQEEHQNISSTKLSYVTCEELRTQLGLVEILDVKGHAIYSGQSIAFSCQEHPPGTSRFYMKPARESFAC